MDNLEKNNYGEQINLFGDNLPESDFEALPCRFGNSLSIVKATFIESTKTDWAELFDGFDYLSAITFSSGIDFVNKVVGKFKHSEIIFGCEGVMNNDTSAIMAMQAKVVQEYVKRKSAIDLAKKLEDGSLELFVSRDNKSHEKIFILYSDNGRSRVITGSANLSATAFCGLQRENIVCFDDSEAYEYYHTLFDDFKKKCSDCISYNTIVAAIKDNEYLEDNIQDIPIMKTVENEKYVFLEETNGDDSDVELVAGIKGLESELKPMVPKLKKDNGKTLITNEVVAEVKRKYVENREVKKVKEKKLPKLHLDYKSKTLDFNGKQITLSPDSEKIKSDIKCLVGYFQGFTSFNGNVLQTQKNYFSFMNWYFASIFMPYLRLTAYKNNYEMIPFPVFGIIYGDSNGGKSTFTKLLSKMMCNQKVPLNNSGDFTSTEIENLKRGREGLPIIIDDLAKNQFQNNHERIIKDDEWGIPEKFLNYPAIVITTNKLPSITSDISKRAVTCHIDAKINKEDGAKNSKRINDSMKNATTAFFGEYIRIMLEKIEKIENSMKTEEDFFPDIFKISSETICEIFKSNCETLPEYVCELSFSDYFGDKAISKNAMEKILCAWKSERKQFKVDRRANKLIYSCGENGNIYSLRYISDELPPALNAKMNATSLIMDLDQAEKLFEHKFKKKWFE